MAPGGILMNTRGIAEELISGAALEALATSRRWVFGTAALDERTLELQVNGQLVRMERKPLEVLLYLLRHAGEVVTKNELAENLWPGRILTETVLTRCISLIRQALNDDERTVVKTVHGYGYRLTADIKVEASAAPAAPALDFRVGDTVPLRPQWRLLERLGTGGHGEAWLARHEKTHEARVFKFALDESALGSLKREITLYRVLHDSLGADAAIVRVLEWNLDEAPYFLETEYVEGRDLASWAEAQGGLPEIPLSDRLDLAAQIADALAAAHSVGVLHKDLKPGNVLIRPGIQPRVRLCDFGSGSVLDPLRLEAMGITRMGLTKTQAPGESATPLYLAPEVVAGQPVTVKADVYALGVLLYQMVAGDFRKHAAPGWEGEVDDELLREDIALAAAGNPERRLADAAQLAERLRTLEKRRLARETDLAARARAERAKKIQQELKRTRGVALLLLALAVAAITGVVTAYRARNDAMEATVTAKAVSDFLMEDVLRVDSSSERPKDSSYESLLNRAAAQADTRFKNQPEAAASVHWLLGRRYHEIGQIEAAAAQYEHAVALFTKLNGRASMSTLLALERLASIYVDRARIPEALAIAEELRTLWLSGRPRSLSALMVRARMARVLVFAGEFPQAERELRAVLDEIPLAESPTDDARILFQQWFGGDPSKDASIARALSAYVNATLGANVLGEFGDEYNEAESRLREALAVFSEVFGENSEPTALMRFGLGGILATAGAYDEAEKLLFQARDFFEAWLPRKHFYHALPRLFIARLRLEQQRPLEAVAQIQEGMEFCNLGGCTPRLRAELLVHVGHAHARLGNWQKAVTVLSDSLKIYQELHGSNHVGTIKTRVSLAEALLKSGRTREASDMLAAINPKAAAALRPGQVAVAELRRVEGLLALHNKDFARARSALEESLEITTRRLGAGNWRVDRLRKELEQVSAST
jgi:eukaryotic-like serine/threonine-protein kinase